MPPAGWFLPAPTTTPRHTGGDQLRTFTYLPARIGSITAWNHYGVGFTVIAPGCIQVSKTRCYAHQQLLLPQNAHTTPADAMPVYPGRSVWLVLVTVGLPATTAYPPAPLDHRLRLHRHVPHTCPATATAWDYAFPAILPHLPRATVNFGIGGLHTCLPTYYRTDCHGDAATLPTILIGWVDVPGR